MDKRSFLVMTLDSDSEDEIQILSENITNYGNIADPVEITPEIQEKIHRSLEKYAPFQGKIKAIKAYSKKNINSVGTVTASILSTNGQGSQVINMGPVSAFFSSPVRGRANDNSKNRKQARPLTNDSEKVISEIGFLQSLPTDTDEVKVQMSYSSVLPNSPIRKVKVQRLPKKLRVPLTISNPSDGSSPSHSREAGYCSSKTFSPPIKHSCHNSTPLWFQNISQSFDDEIVAEDSPQYERNRNKNVEINEKSSSVLDQNESSHSIQTSTPKLVKNVFSRRNARGDIENIPKSNIQLSSENNEKDDPHLSSSASSTSPTPTESWMSFITLSQLNLAEFGAVAGLCGVEAVTQARKRVNAPMRVLRKRPKK